MMPVDSGPRALGGGPLKGHNLAHHIYADEAGISAHEPVRVVAALVVNVDSSWMAARNALEKAFEAVPPCYRDGFTFHATDVWNGAHLREHWSREDRLAFLLDVMSIPRRLKIAVALGYVYSSTGSDPEYNQAMKITESQFHHSVAFANCVIQADNYLRYFCEPNQLGTIISEDAPGSRDSLRHAVRTFQRYEVVSRSGRLERERAEGKDISGMPDRFASKIERIIDQVHFVDKSGAPLLQIADACAFAFRRFLAELQGGPEMVAAVVGSRSSLHTWRNSNAILFPFIKPLCLPPGGMDFS